VKIDPRFFADLSSPVRQALLPSASTIPRTHFSAIDVACGAVGGLVDDDVEVEGEHSIRRDLSEGSATLTNLM
jgi:hypothetical protein